MPKIQEITDKELWNNFIINLDFEFYSFLQSWQWGEIQQDLWKEIVRYGIFEWKKQIWLFLLLKVRAKRGSYYFIPHGPLIKWDFFSVFENIFPDLQELARKDKMDFIRFNSPVKNLLVNKNAFKSLGCKDAPMHEHVEDSHLLDLSISQEDLLSNINKKDRYYINRGKKEWVEIKKENSPEHIQVLKDLHWRHAKWDANGNYNYHAFSEKFIDSLYSHFDDSEIITISASYEWKVESILMTIQFWNRTVYYIAASDVVHKKFSPNYLCQWEAILHAKENGAKLYNFWWVSPDNNPKHPIAWVTKFKRKFWGYDYSLLHAQDYPLTWKYYLNWCIETVRRKKRGYYYKRPE